MKPKTALLALIAVGCGLLAALVATQLGGGKPAALVTVYVAAVELRPGTAITDPERQLAPRPYLPDSVPAGSFTNAEDLRGKTVVRAVDRNNPITSKDLDGDRLLADQPPGTRAVTLRVNVENSQAGFALPGSRVDLVCTLADPAVPARTLTRTFLQRVLILAVNTQQTPQGQANVIPNATTVTLAVTPAEAERVIWAKERTQITMVLRSLTDKAVVPTEGVSSPFGDERQPTKEQMVRVLVPRKDLLPGTTIDDVNATFMEVNLPANAVPRAIPENERQRLSRQVVKHLVPAGYPITDRHLELVVQVNDKDNVSWLLIQEPDKPLRKVKYVNGSSDPDVRATPERPAPEQGRIPENRD